MPDCPVCHHELEKPPEDIRDWFRCDNCGTPLQFPSTLGKMLYWISIFGVLLAARPYFHSSEQVFQEAESFAVPSRRVCSGRVRRIGAAFLGNKAVTAAFA
jgi:hypothetical protein